MHSGFQENTLYILLMATGLSRPCEGVNEMRNVSRWSAWIWALALMMGAATAAAQDRKKAPEGARLYLISPENGATLKSPVTARFGLTGMVLGWGTRITCRSTRR